MWRLLTVAMWPCTPHAFHGALGFGSNPLGTDEEIRPQDSRDLEDLDGHILGFLYSVRGSVTGSAGT